MCRLFIILSVLFLQGSLKAQQKKSAFSFRSINQVGILYGENGQDALVQTINGVRYKTWFAGVGAGIDFYHLRSVPVFLDIRKEFPVLSNSRIVPFVYADGGLHYPWARREDHTSNYESKFSNGAWCDVGLGFSVKAKSRHAVLLSAGYSYKRVKEDVKFYNPEWDDISEEVRSFEYNLNRISVKLGWQF